MKWLASVVAVIALAACGPGPKPAELVQLEAARAGEHSETIEQRFPKLFNEAAKQYKRALVAHDDNEPEDALHFTRIASITWRTAVAKSQHLDHENSEKAGKNRLRQADEQVGLAKARVAAATDAIAREQRNIAMIERLAAAEKAAASDRRTAGAKAKVDEAALKLKEAESMEAATHAPGPFNKATASLKMALDAFEGGNYKEAEGTAAASIVDSLAAIAAAKPLFDKAQARRAIDNRLKALLEQSSRVPGAEARLETRGLVITLRGLFPSGKSDIKDDKAAMVKQASELAKQYNEFRLIVEGHTDNRGRAAKNLSLSEERARAVSGNLSAQGIDAGRITSLGRGDEEPIADNAKREGRAQNRRVELVFVRPVIN